jgi:hypothetical protein
MSKFLTLKSKAMNNSTLKRYGTDWVVELVSKPKRVSACILLATVILSILVSNTIQSNVVLVVLLSTGFLISEYIVSKYSSRNKT